MNRLRRNKKLSIGYSESLYRSSVLSIAAIELLEINNKQKKNEKNEKINFNNRHCFHSFW